MKIIIGLICILLMARSSVAQEVSPRLLIKQSIVNTKSGKIDLTCVILNGSNKNIFYKPNHNDDFCLRLNYLLLKDLSNNAEVNYFPCAWVADFSKIDINSTNSVELNPNCNFTFHLILNTAKFNNKLKQNHNYEITFRVNHKDICGNGLPCKAFTGVLKASGYQFIYK